MDALADSFRLLADPTRLRILRLVRREELNAGEIGAVLGVGASTLSRSLALLRDAGFVRERREGRFAFYAAAEADPAWAGVLARIGEAPDDAGDLARLDDVLRARRERAVTDGAAKRRFVPGRSWAAWARALAWLVPPGLRVADLGSGEGALALEMARFAAEVVAVDRDPEAVRRGKALAKKQGVRNVRFVRGEIEATTLPEGEFDLVLLSQTLHCADEPQRVLAEAARLLTPGGRVLVLDLLPHREEWVRERLGHRRLGFAPNEIETLLVGAGLTDVQVERVGARAGDPFRVVVATGVASPAPSGPRPRRKT